MSWEIQGCFWPHPLSLGEHVSRSASRCLREMTVFSFGAHLTVSTRAPCSLSERIWFTKLVTRTHRREVHGEGVREGLGGGLGEVLEEGLGEGLGAVCSRQHLKGEYMMMFVSQEVHANYFGIS